MKKIILLFLSCILLTGCTKEEKELHIETIIEENNNYKISINYPKTNYDALDKMIDNYVTSSYQTFKKSQNNHTSLENSLELNIDYTFYQSDCIFSISLFKSENNDTEVETFNYHYKNNRFFELNDITDASMVYASASDILFKRYGNIIDIQRLHENLKTSLFSLDHENLYLYYPPYTLSSTYADTIIIDIPLSKLDIQMKNITPSFEEVYPNQINTQKVNDIIDMNQKVIAITFDDGPSSYTKEILSILKEYDAVATFFILGNKVETYRDTLKLSIENGNELGNHTYNHKWLTKLNDEEIKKQITDTQEIIESTLGYTPTLFRPSYGSINARVKKDISLDVVMWNIDTMDWKYKSVDKIVNRAVRNAEDSKIILMHETYARTKDALPKILSILKEKGFSFVTVSELKEITLLRKLNEK